jgi:Protein of unknown function (DUF4012)
MPSAKFKKKTRKQNRKKSAINRPRRAEKKKKTKVLKKKTAIVLKKKTAYSAKAKPVRIASVGILKPVSKNIAPVANKITEATPRPETAAPRLSVDARRRQNRNMAWAFGPAEALLDEEEAKFETKLAGETIQDKTPAKKIALLTRNEKIIAPATPFIPKKTIKLPLAAAPKIKAVALLQKPASEHIVDLRVFRTISKKTKRSVRTRSSFIEPRAMSHRRSKFSWENSVPVAFAKFSVALFKRAVVGLGKIIVLPLALALSLAEKIDLDRKKNISPARKTAEHIFEAKPLLSRGFASVPAEVSPQSETEPAAPPSPTPIARPFNLRRAVLSFATVSVAVVLPLEGLNLYRSLNNVKGEAETAGAQGISLAASAESGVLPDSASIESARVAFANAGAAVAKVGFWQNAFIDLLPVIGEKYRSGKELVSAGENLIEASASLHGFTDALAVKSDDVTQKIAALEKAAAATEPALGAAVADLLKVQSIPTQISEENFRHNLSLLVSADDSLKSFLDLTPSLYQILGQNSAKRYLVVFQNNAEIRPTGGFMGSFALVDVLHGRITKIEVPAGGPYDLQGSLKASVLAPDPLRLVNARWQFQDANWFPDFPASAKNIIWFYNKAGGPTVDGVIAINAPVLAKLVDAVGPINMPDYGEIVVGDTVLKTTEEIVESDAARQSGKPKQFIADLLPKVLDKIMTGDRDTMLRAVSIFGDSLNNKDIQLYMRDGEVEKKMSEMGWTGELAPLPPKTDSFELVRANIAGQKTDAVVSVHIDHKSSIADDGTITDTVTVTLKHNGVKNEPMYGVRNVEYLRAYVPEGSALVADSGDIRPPSYKLFDVPPTGCAPDQTLADITGPVIHDQTTGVAVNNEFGRTVFGAWTQTDPGESSSVTFVYELPWKAVPTPAAPSLSSKLLMTAVPAASFSQGMIFTRQPGAYNTTVTASLALPLSWYPLYADPEGIATSAGYQTSFELTADKHFSLSAAAPAF